MCVCGNTLLAEEHEKEHYCCSHEHEEKEVESCGHDCEFSHHDQLEFLSEKLEISLPDTLNFPNRIIITPEDFSDVFSVATNSLRAPPPFKHYVLIPFRIEHCSYQL